MAQKIRLSCTLAYPDDMHGEDVMTLARAAAESIGAGKDMTVSLVSNMPTLDAVLCELERILVESGYKDMGYAQTMPRSNEKIQRFLKDRKELVEVSSTDDPDKDFLAALLDGDEK